MDRAHWRMLKEITAPACHILCHGFVTFRALWRFMPRLHLLFDLHKGIFCDAVKWSETEFEEGERAQHFLARKARTSEIMGRLKFRFQGVAKGERDGDLPIVRGSGRLAMFARRSASASREAASPASADYQIFLP